MIRLLCAALLLLGSSFPSWAAWTKVQATTTYCGDSAASCTVTIPSPAAGNLLAIAAMYNIGATNITISSVSGAGTWVHPSTCSSEVTNSESIDWIYNLSATSGTSVTVTLSGTASYIDIYYFEYSGSSPFSFDTCAVNTGSSGPFTRPPAGSITTTGTNDLALAGVKGDQTIASGSAVSPSPWTTPVLLANDSEAVDHALGLSAGTTQALFTASAASYTIGSTIAFKDSSSAVTQYKHAEALWGWTLGPAYVASSQADSCNGACTISGFLGGPPSLTASLSGQSTGTATASKSGVYTFSGLANGTYTITPSAVTGYTFSPTSTSVTLNGSNATAADVDAQMSSLATQIYADEFDTSQGNGMALNEGHPEGVPSSYDFYTHAFLGNAIPAANTAAELWAGLYYGPANTATNTIVNVRNFKLCALQGSTWSCTSYTGSQMEGENDSEDFNNYVGSMTPTVLGDGTISIPMKSATACNNTAGDPQTGNCLSHFYPNTRAPTSSSITGVVAYMEARLILINSGGVDDRANAQFLMEVGADTYHSTTSSNDAVNGVVPPIAGGKFKYVENNWRSFTMTTLTSAQLAANPPPITVTGIIP